MALVKDLLYYIVSNYPNPSHLSKARTTKLVYLSDWKHSIEYNRQITDIKWYFNNHGPFVWDVIETAEQYPELFEIEETENYHGEPKTLIGVNSRSYDPDLDQSERNTADQVINATCDLQWDSFVNLVYSTYPVVTTDQYEDLNLPELAGEYRESKVPA